MELIKGTVAITKAIQSIQARGKKLDDAIQLAGLSVLAHAEEHGDVTLCNRLLEAMPKGGRKLALADWMLKFGKVKVQTEKALSKEAPLMYSKEGTTDMDGATATPWYECKKEKTIEQTFDVSAMIAQMIAKIEREIAHNSKLPEAERKEIKGADKLAGLQALVK